MTYNNMNDVRIRMNVIALKLNEASNYGRRPLPPQFADLHREWLALADIKPAEFKGGTTVVDIPDCNI